MSLPDTSTTIEHPIDLPTADQLSDIVIVALDSGDMEGVVAALRVMAVVDPRRAAETLAAIELGLAMRREEGE